MKSKKIVPNLEVFNFDFIIHLFSHIEA